MTRRSVDVRLLRVSSRISNIKATIRIYIVTPDASD